MGAACGECCWANERCKLSPQPKKSYESWAGQGKGRGLSPLGGAAPSSTGGKMGRKKGGRGGQGGASAGGMVSA